jgi:hypothetical protein
MPVAAASSKLLSTTQRRLLATGGDNSSNKPSEKVTETINSHIKDKETNELNKPQWERSDRYVIASI